MKKYRKILKFLIPISLISFVLGFSYLKSSSLSNLTNLLSTNPNLEFSITYNLDDGKWKDTIPPEKFKVYEETSIPNPEKDNNLFLGWTSDELEILSPQKDLVIPKYTNKNINLTANWKSLNTKLIDGATFNSIIKSMNCYTSKASIKISFDKVESMEGLDTKTSAIDISQNKDKSIIAYYDDKDTIHIASDSIIYANENCSSMFKEDASNNKITNIYFNNFNTSKVKDMNFMFYHCEKLSFLDLSKFDLSKCEKYLYMFAFCYNLSSEITISNPNVDLWGGLGSIVDMFMSCSTNSNARFMVKYIDDNTKEIAREMVSAKSPASNVYLYEPNYLMDSKELNKIMTDEVKSYMSISPSFYIDVHIGTNVKTGYTNNLKTIDISKNQDNSIKLVINSKGSFLDTTYHFNIISDEMIYFNEDSSYLFANLIYISNFEVETGKIYTSEVKNMSHMFESSSDFDSFISPALFDLSSFNTSKVTNMSYMFGNNDCISELDLSSFDTSNVTDMSHMFESSFRLNSLNISNFDTSNVTDMSYMFNGCPRLNSEITIMNPNIVNFNEMFLGCSNWQSSSDYLFVVKYIDEATKEVARKMVATKSDGDNVVLYEPNYLMNGKELNKIMIDEMESIKAKNFYIDIYIGTNVKEGYTNNLKTIDISKNQNNSVKLVINTKTNFSDTTYHFNIISDEMIYFNEDSSYLFANLLYIKNFEVESNKINTSNVTDMSHMFENSSDLNSFMGDSVFDLSSFDTSNVTDMSHMFESSFRLNSLNISNFDTSKVIDMSRMFYGCSRLNSEITIMNPNIVNFNEMFLNCSNWESSSDYLFVVNYIDNDTKEVARKMVATKNDGDNVVLNSVVLDKKSSLIKGTAFFEKLKSMPNYVNTTKIIFDKVNSINDIKSKTDAIDLSSDQNNSIIAYFDDKDTIYVVSENKIFANEDCYSMFKDSSLNESKILSIEFNNFDTSKVTNMSYMFSGCTGLTELNLSSFDTSKVTNMNGMFYDCSKVTNLNLIDLNTTNVTNMNRMFYGCTRLTGLDLSKLNTTNVTNMNRMFYGCTGLTELNLSSFNTSNVTDMSYMFYGCTGLTELDLSKLNTTNITNMSYMFYGCTGLTELDLSSFDTSKVTNMSYMFSGCTGLTELNLSSFNTSNVTDMSSIFRTCTGLTGLDLSKLNTTNVTNMSSMFYGCTGLTELDLSSFDTSKVTNMSYMFSGCTGLTGLDLSKLNTTNVTNMSYMFSGCTGLTGLDLSKLNTTNVTNMSSMFSGCTRFTGLDLSKLNTTNVTNMSSMFSGCTGLTGLDLSKLNTTNVTYMNRMFYGCAGLTELNLSSFDTSKVTDMNSMFYGCASLTELNLSSFDTSKVTYMNRMFYGCAGLTELNLSSFDTSKVTDMNSMFYGCTELTELDLSSFDTSNVTDMRGMFKLCSSLISIINIENFNTSKVEMTDYMFDSCKTLVTLDLSNWNTSSLVVARNMFTNAIGVSGEITIMNAFENSYNYSQMFLYTSMGADDLFIVNYIDDDTKSTASEMVETRSSSKVVLGSQKIKP